MAKKKATKEEIEEEDFGDLVDDEFEDDDVESVYPDLDKKKEVSKPKEEQIAEEMEEGEEEIDEFDVDIEDELQPVEYKYLDIEIKHGLGDNDYEISVKGQSHGFCNILVKHLLDIEGVNIAAYKVTRLQPPQIFIRLENGFDIKEILFKGISSLREEVESVEKVFQKLM